MASSYRNRFLGIMRRSEQDLTALFNGLSSAAAREVNRRADADGQIPLSNLYDLQQAVGDMVTAVFVGRTDSQSRSAFRILPDGSMFPLSAYMRSLWSSIEEATRLPVEQHADILDRWLPEDLKASIKLAASMPAMEQAQFRPNPFANYDPPHTWVDPNGYQLSDRIWRTSGTTRRKIDMLLEESIAEGRAAIDIADDLETFLKPGRQLRRTNRPYGTDASYDGMRLARTEITRAHAQASEASALANPFVEGIEVALSLSHPKPDICDEAAAAGPFPKGEIPASYQIPLHPHCLCYYRYVMTDNRGEVIESLRADIQRERGAYAMRPNPLQVDRFVETLLRGAITLTGAQRLLV